MLGFFSTRSNSPAIVGVFAKQARRLTNNTPENTNAGGVFGQKLDYIHNNPVKAGLCKYAEDYKYSSARFYEKNENDWDFLAHFAG